MQDTSKQSGFYAPDPMGALETVNSSISAPLPSNFIFVNVTEVFQLCPDFLRVTFTGIDLSGHRNASIHFRLVQPPLDTEVEWPTIGENGSAKWHDGPGAPHRPVYTTRAVDHRDNILTTDIFIHHGGRTSEWAQSILRGDTSRVTVGLSGPVGGGLMEADRVLMASDETGFPAAARILEAFPTETTGEIFLEARNGAECGYPIEAPKNIKVTWLSRANGERLVDAALDALPRHAASKIWYAGEREDARKVRDAAKAVGRASVDLRISGFWRK